MIENGVKILPNGDLGHPDPKSRVISSGRSIDLTQAISSLLELGAIERVGTKGMDRFYQNLFIVQQGIKKRPVLDCRSLNEHIPSEHFKMTSIRSIKNMVLPGDYCTKVDLKDAYLQIPIHPDQRKYLSICYKDRHYQFTSLPFGLKSAPWIFTRIMKAVLYPLQQKGFRLSAYLDDITLCHQDPKILEVQTQELVRHLMNLGFQINLKKSILVPNQRIEVLGFILDTKKNKLAIPFEKVKKIRKEAKAATRMQGLTIRKLASLIGMLVATKEGLSLAQLQTRHLNGDLRKALKTWSWESEEKITLTSESLKELDWWQHLGNKLSEPIWPKEKSLTLQTDASQRGWGAVMEGEKLIQGLWTKEESSRTSNQRELLAVLRALETWQEVMANKTVGIQSDNQTTVYNLVGQGRSRIPAILELTKQIHFLAHHRKIRLEVSYIPGKQNIQADRASRVFPSGKDDYTLNQRTFEELNQKFGPLTLDLFANADNKKVRNFVDLERNAFQQKWPEKGAYAFSPWILIHRIINKVQRDQVKQITVVTPDWPRQPWYNTLRAMAMAAPIRIPHQEISHGRESRLAFKRIDHLAWNISSIICAKGRFQKRRQL